jgi:hypothetical protein
MDLVATEQTRKVQRLATSEKVARRCTLSGLLYNTDYVMGLFKVIP